MTMDQLKEAFKEKELVYGFNQTIKNIKQGKVTTVFLSKDAQEDMRSEILASAKVSGVNVIELDATAHEVGAVCKKPFQVSVLSY